MIRIAAKLDGEGSPKNKVMTNADRLIAAQSVERIAEARDKVAA